MYGEDKAKLEKANGAKRKFAFTSPNSKVELSLPIYFLLYIDRGNPIGRLCQQGKE